MYQYIYTYMYLFTCNTCPLLLSRRSAFSQSRRSRRTLCCPKTSPDRRNCRSTEITRLQNRMDHGDLVSCKSAPALPRVADPAVFGDSAESSLCLLATQQHPALPARDESIVIAQSLQSLDSSHCFTSHVVFISKRRVFPI